MWVTPLSDHVCGLVLCRYHDCFSDGAKLHIVMEWAEGGDLKGFISRQAKAGTRLSEDQVLTYFVQASTCTGLNCLTWPLSCPQESVH